MYDVCYVVKDTTENEELRYSLRLIDNLPNVRNVYIFGGCPDFLKPKYLKKRIKQSPPTQENKWDNSGKIFWEILNDPDVSDNFYLMMDDVYVTKPISEYVNLSRPSMYTTRHSDYYNAKRDAYKWLLVHGKPTRDFEQHRPFLYNKQKARELFPMYPIQTCFRSVYGNWYHIKTEQHPDCKIFSKTFDKFPLDDWCLSTTDKVFYLGKAGEWLKKYAPNKSRFEK